MGFVLDASVTLAWCFADEQTDATEALRDRVADEKILAPALWVSETTNALLTAVRRDRLEPRHADRLQELLAALPIEVDAEPPDRRTLTAIAMRYGLSAYDATYLLLAERSGLPLATLDARLRDAARAAGVGVLPD